MTRKLKLLGPAVIIALFLAGLPAPSAATVAEETLPTYFTADVESEETAKIDGEQIGTNVISLGSRELTCTTVKYNGEAVSSGPSSNEVTIEPSYEGCHAVVLGTKKPATVAANGCGYIFSVVTTTTESEEADFLLDTDVECPGGKQIEIHVYNNEGHTETLCKYDVGPQSGLTGATAVNQANTPLAVNDVVANLALTGISVTRTAGSALICGAEKQTATYEGEATLRATNASSEFVEAAVAVPKRFSFGAKTATVKGEKGSAKLVTEIAEIDCTDVTYHGTSPSSLPATLTIKPTYAGCTAFGKKNDVHVNFEGCEYLFELEPGTTDTGGGEGTHTTGPMKFVCTGGKRIKFEITKAGGGGVTCTIYVPNQTAADVVDTKNKGTGAGETPYVGFTSTLNQLDYEVENDGGACGKTGEIIVGAELKGLVDVKAFKDEPGGAQIKFRISGS